MPAPNAKALPPDSGLPTVRSQAGLPKPTVLVSSGFGRWLNDVGGSLAFSTCQTSRLFFVVADAEGRTMAQERIVGSAMGLAVDADMHGVPGVFPFAAPRPPLDQQSELSPEGTSP